MCWIGRGDVSSGSCCFCAQATVANLWTTGNFQFPFQVRLFEFNFFGKVETLLPYAGERFIALSREINWLSCYEVLIRKFLQVDYGNVRTVSNVFNWFHVLVKIAGTNVGRIVRVLVLDRPDVHRQNKFSIMFSICIAPWSTTLDIHSTWGYLL